MPDPLAGLAEQRLLRALHLLEVAPPGVGFGNDPKDAPFGIDHRQLVGGVVLGLVEAWGGQYLPGTLVNAIAFAVLVLVLIVRPSGLVGRAYYAARQEV